MDKKGLTPVELIITVVFIGIFVGIILSIYFKLEREVNKIRAENDLTNINIAVRYFYIKNKRFPQNLYELKKKGYLFIHKTPIISNSSKFVDSTMLDPFGNPYIYDNKTGKVYFSEKTKKILNF